MADPREPEEDDDADKMDLFMLQSDDELQHHVTASSDQISPTPVITEAQTTTESVEPSPYSIGPASPTAAALSARKRKYSASWHVRSSPQSLRWSPYENRTAHKDVKLLVRPRRKRVISSGSSSRSSAPASTLDTRRNSLSPLLSDNEPLHYAPSDNAQFLRISIHGSEGKVREDRARDLSRRDEIIDQEVMSEDDTDLDDDYVPDPEEDEVEEPISEGEQLSDQEIDDLPLGSMLANDWKVLPKAVVTTPENQPWEPTAANFPEPPHNDEYDIKLCEGTSKGPQALTWGNGMVPCNDDAPVDTRAEVEAYSEILHEPRQPPRERLQQKAQSAKAEVPPPHATAHKLQDHSADVSPTFQSKHRATHLLQPPAGTQTPGNDMKPSQPDSKTPRHAPIADSHEVPAPRSNVPSVSCTPWVPSPPCSISQQSNGAGALGLSHSEIMFNLTHASSSFGYYRALAYPSSERHEDSSSSAAPAPSTPLPAISTAPIPSFLMLYSAHPVYPFATPCLSVPYQMWPQSSTTTGKQ